MSLSHPKSKELPFYLFIRTKCREGTPSLLRVKLNKGVSHLFPSKGGPTFYFLPVPLEGTS